MESAYQCRRCKRHGFNPWVGKIPWRRTHSSILAWRIPWTDKPGRLQSMGLQRVEHNWATNTLTSVSVLLALRYVQMNGPPNLSGFTNNLSLFLIHIVVKYESSISSLPWWNMGMQPSSTLWHFHTWKLWSLHSSQSMEDQQSWRIARDACRPDLEFF